MSTGVTVPTFIVYGQGQGHPRASISHRFIKFFETNIQRIALRTMRLLIFANTLDIEILRDWLV